jgi:hypothetical protein
MMEREPITNGARAQADVLQRDARDRRVPAAWRSITLGQPGQASGLCSDEERVTAPGGYRGSEQVDSRSLNAARSAAVGDEHGLVVWPVVLMLLPHRAPSMDQIARAGNPPAIFAPIIARNVVWFSSAYR